jgi:hypothetical protein
VHDAPGYDTHRPPNGAHGQKREAIEGVHHNPGHNQSRNEINQRQHGTIPGTSAQRTMFLRRSESCLPPWRSCIEARPRVNRPNRRPARRHCRRGCGMPHGVPLTRVSTRLVTISASGNACIQGCGARARMRRTDTIERPQARLARSVAMPLATAVAVPLLRTARP